MREKNKVLVASLLLQIAEGEIQRAEREKKYYKDNGISPFLDKNIERGFAEHLVKGWNAAKDQDIAYWREQMKLIKSC